LAIAGAGFQTNNLSPSQLSLSFLKHFKMKRILFCTAIISALFGRAQTDTAELSPVEVKTVRAGGSAPFAKTNISKAQIQAQNLGQDLPFILAQTPSVVASSDAGNGIGYTGSAYVVQMQQGLMLPSMAYRLTILKVGGLSL
jgi:hypothetical protein